MCLALPKIAAFFFLNLSNRISYFRICEQFVFCESLRQNFFRNTDFQIFISNFFCLLVIIDAGIVSAVRSFRFRKTDIFCLQHLDEELAGDHLLLSP